MEQYGAFSQAIVSLDGGLSEVRAAWQDQTAQTYDSINENMKACAAAVWQVYTNAAGLYEMEKKNYNESEFEQYINELGARASAV